MGVVACEISGRHPLFFYQPSSSILVLERGVRPRYKDGPSFHSIQKEGVANICLPLDLSPSDGHAIVFSISQQPHNSLQSSEGNSVVSLVCYILMASCCFCKVNYKEEQRVA